MAIEKAKPQEFKKADRSEKERIESDITQFEENVALLTVPKGHEHVVELAKMYCKDTRFFLDKKDYVTAFGCINYAHGLIDAFRIKK
ncbi:MAG TPA: DUF357 domain-containing protein [Candidatus Micrarchaeota archaeon]|nr:DUF357 domain-containing protein [Candidatus Micrarchaeota archaeon]